MTVLGLNRPILPRCIETRTRLLPCLGIVGAPDVAVAHDEGVGVTAPQFYQQVYDGCLLLYSAVVGRVAFGVDAAYVGDVYRRLVVAPHSVAHLLLVEQLHHPAVWHRHIMIARRMPSAALEFCQQLFNTRLAAARRAMDKNSLDVSHDNVLIIC